MWSKVRNTLINIFPEDHTEPEDPVFESLTALASLSAGRLAASVALYADVL